MQPITRISAALALASGFLLAAATWPQERATEVSAWQALLQTQPAAAEDPTIGPLERRVLQVLTRDQADRWLEGADPATLLLADGTPLSSFIRSAVESMSFGPGLAFFPVPACTFASTRLEGSRSGAPLQGIEQRGYQLRGKLRDLSGQGGSASGCGVPDSARAVFVRVRAIDAAGKSLVSVHPGNGPSSGSGFLRLGETGKRESAAITSALCAGECRDGDLAVGFRTSVSGSSPASTHLELDVLGYFERIEPPAGSPARASAAAADRIVAQVAPIGRPSSPISVAPESITGGSVGGLVGEVRIFAGNFEPDGWIFADGRLLTIRDNLALFEVVGNTYGGNGLSTFGLPDLRGRLPMGQGAGAGLTNRNLGEETGEEAVALDVTQLPAHDHALRATNSSATQTQPAGNVLATATTAQYLNTSTSVAMGTDSIGATGGDAPHDNVQPSTVLSFLVRRGPAENVLLKGLFGPIPGGDLACAPLPPEERSIVGRRSGTVKLDRHSGLQFTSGGIDYLGLIELEHEDGIGTIWYAIAKNHDLDLSPVNVRVVLAPDIVIPVARTPSGPNSSCAAPIPTREELLLAGFYTEVGNQSGSGDRAEAAGAADQRTSVSSSATTLDRHSGLQFTSGGVDYLGIRILEYEDGIGTIWLAIAKNHDLDTGPVQVKIVLAPDAVTPVLRTGPGALAASYEPTRGGALASGRGLFYRPLPACTFASTLESHRLSTSSEPERSRSFQLRGVTRDLSVQGGSRTGCGVPTEARAVLIALRSHGSSGVGAVSLHPPGAAPMTGLVTFDPFGASASTATVELCSNDCPEGDLVLEILEESEPNSSTHVTLDVLGYFRGRPTPTELAARAPGKDTRGGPTTTTPDSVATRRERAFVDTSANLGEIRLFAGNFEPKGWIFADGRLLALGGNRELFQILGNTYGGDGMVTLGLPDLRGRAPMGQGAGPGLTSRTLGEEPGSESVILSVAEIASHDHTLRATNSSATGSKPQSLVLATADTAQYLNVSSSVTMGSDSIGATGSNAPHSNVAPSTVLSFLIATSPSAFRASSSPQQPGERVRVDSSATRLDRHSGLKFTSGAVEYLGIQLLEHEDGIGTIWLAIPRNHDLETAPVDVQIVLAPDVVTPV